MKVAIVTVALGLILGFVAGLTEMGRVIAEHSWLPHSDGRCYAVDMRDHPQQYDDRVSK